MSVIARYDLKLDTLLKLGYALDEIDRIRHDPPGTAKAEMVYDWILDNDEFLRQKYKRQYEESEAQR